MTRNVPKTNQQGVSKSLVVTPEHVSDVSRMHLSPFMINEKIMIFMILEIGRIYLPMTSPPWKVTIFEPNRCADAHCGLPTHGAKHFPPPSGPFGGSHGHLATYSQNHVKMTHLGGTSSTMMSWSTSLTP